MNAPRELDDEIVTTGAKVRFGYPWWLRPLLFRDVVAITFGRRIWLSATVAEQKLAPLLRHELVHVRQFAELGMLRFLWRYLAEYVRLRRSGLSSTAAYAAISFEREALAAEDGEHV
jgi:hypothetical protein